MSKYQEALNYFRRWFPANTVRECGEYEGKEKKYNDLLQQAVKKAEKYDLIKEKIFALLNEKLRNENQKMMYLVDEGISDFEDDCNFNIANDKKEFIEDLIDEIKDLYEREQK